MTEKQPVTSELSRGHILRKLFLSTLYLSAFTFGGGYVIVTLLKQRFVDKLHWISEEEMLDLVAIAQSSPGPIAVNGAIVLGYQLAGFPGILMAVLGAVIPPFVILSVISFFYSSFRDSFLVSALLQGMRSGVSAVILSVVFDMAAGIVKKKDVIHIIVMVLAFIANYFLKVNAIWIILTCILIGVVLTLVRTKKGVKA